MHVISQRRIWQAKIDYPDAASALDGWYRVIKTNNYDSYADLKKTFNSVDKVKDKYVFNIGGNKYRLITSIHFNRRKLYIRRFLKHSEYDRGAWR